MTQADVAEILGPPVKRRTEDFPEGAFMGPQAGMVGIIAPGQPYEEWEYVGGGDTFLIFLAGRDFDDLPNQWNVVGKTHYPTGAQF